MYALSNLENKKGVLQTENINLYVVDFDYIRQHRIPIVAGRDFSPSFATDSTQALIINEHAVKELGYTKPEDAIGRRFSSYGRDGRVVGVSHAEEELVDRVLEPKEAPEVLLQTFVEPLQGLVDRDRRRPVGQSSPLPGDPEQAGESEEGRRDGDNGNGNDDRAEFH